MNYSIDEPCRAIEAQFEVLEDYLDHKFAEADDVSYGRYLIKQYDRIESAKKLLLALKGTVEEILEDEDLRSLNTDDLIDRPRPELRSISVPVTEGMIKQNLLTLTQAKKRGVVSQGEYFTIDPDGGERFETKMVDPGNRLQERGKIAAFYKRHGVEDGDRVILEETKPGRWRLSFDQAHKKARQKAFDEVSDL